MGTVMSVPTVTLESGDELPMAGVGTWNIEGDTAREAVRTALDAGYAHVDTAEGYHNEAAVGDALAGYDRESVFLTSKVLPKHLHYDSLVEACEDSLERLGTDYLDLYLIHWPNPAVSVRESLQAMASLRDRGLVRNVGVSNFSAYQLSTAHHVSPVPIAVNQVEFHPWFQRPDLVEYCRETDTVVEAAAPLARGEVFDDDTLSSIADDHGGTLPPSDQLGNVPYHVVWGGGERRGWFTVSDTGIGMAPDELGRLFVEFARIKNAHTRNIPGSGLGLSIVKRLARLYQGEVTVESEVGVGSTFTVKLCARAAEEAIPAGNSGDSGDSGEGERESA